MYALAAVRAGLREPTLMALEDSAARGAVQSLTKTGLRICANHDAAPVSRIRRIVRLVGLRSLNCISLNCGVSDSPICRTSYIGPVNSLNCSEALLSPRGTRTNRLSAGGSRCSYRAQLIGSGCNMCSGQFATWYSLTTTSIL